MTDQAIRVVPAGWYEDPASSAHVRWWNGLAWTEHTAPKPTGDPELHLAAPSGDDGFAGPPLADQRVLAGQRAIGGQPESADEHAGSMTATGSTTATGSIPTPEIRARIEEARDLERQYGISTAENDVIARGTQEFGADHAGGSTTLPDYRPWNAEPEPVPEEPRTSTPSAWFIALWPVFTLVAAAVAAYLAFYVVPEPSVAGIPVVAAVVLVPTLLTIVWAVTDARRLRSRGFRPASPALALLGPLVYLVARRTRVTGSRPLVTLILLTLLAAGGPTAAYLTGSAGPVTNALEIQQAVQADREGRGTLASVSCPAFVENLERGALYTCDGVLPDGSSKLVWVSLDAADGSFSYAFAAR